MKKMMSLMALAVIGSVVAASAEDTVSANAVGYVKCTVPAGGLQIVSVPFENMASDDGTFKFGDTQIAADAPKGTIVMFWDAVNQTWSPGTKGTKGWAAAQSNQVLTVGEAFFLKNPDAEKDLEVTAAGEVPSAEKLYRSFAGDGKALSVAASAYPVDIKFGETELAQKLQKGASVMFWDVANQTWSPGTKGTKGWAAAQSNQIVKAGEGFFIQPTADGTWEAEKPYTWP